LGHCAAFFGAVGRDAGSGQVFPNPRLQLGLGHLIIFLAEGIIDVRDMALFEFGQGDLVYPLLLLERGVGKICGELNLNLTSFAWIHSIESGNEPGDEGIGLKQDPKFFGFTDLA
jgi:hypothetical protein